MDKSDKRRTIEREIKKAHHNSLNVALELLRDELKERYNITLKPADLFKPEYQSHISQLFSDSSFMGRVRDQTRNHWVLYLDAYCELEALDEKEGHLGMQECAKVLDKISSIIPIQERQVCYYPFAGVDFYWARIFDKVMCQDIAYDQQSVPNMWWNANVYQTEKRESIIGKMRARKIIPESAVIECSLGDADTAVERYNDGKTTLLVKGGHDFLGYIDQTFAGERLYYTTIITVSAVNTTAEIEQRLERDDYHRVKSLKGTNWLIPYAMDLKRINIFRKKGGQ